jgi:putative glutamine amidotransferase
VSRPLIGITTYHRETSGRSRFTLPSAYVDSLRRAGGLAVLVTPGEGEPDELLARLDGLVLSGGGDLDPASYGGDVHSHTYAVCAERDAFELALLRGALERGTPTLAICRGMQILNVALGGGLHGHLPDVVGETVVHRSSQTEAAAHPVRLAPRSRLAERIGAGELASVPSWHHQALDRLGAGLEPVAWAPDDVVEAVELRGEPQLVAVQWHPELAGPTPAGGGLFEALVARARDRARGRRAGQGTGSGRR